LGELTAKYPVRFSGPWNLGPDVRDIKKVSELVDCLIENWGTGSWNAENPGSPKPEAGLLMLDISKSINGLNWRPKLTTNDAIKLTAAWYKSQSEGLDMEDFSESQIAYFEKLQE
jgi:CDP-glucose 4,6-dehydratase